MFCGTWFSIPRVLLFARMAAVLFPAVCTAAHATESEAIVAEVGGQRLRAADLLDRGKPLPDAASAERAIGETLRVRVWRYVFEEYARARNIEATPAEINAQIAGHRRLRARLDVERVAQRESLAKELAAPTFDEKRRRQAQEHLDTLDRLAAFEAERAKELRDPARRAIAEQSERNVARIWVHAWKVNQALLREFGGRIIFQQAGWEPIDAYRKLLERSEASRDFVVHDPKLRAAVYAYFEYRFVYADEQKARFYFEKPYWERTPEEMRAAGF